MAAAGRRPCPSRTPKRRQHYGPAWAVVLFGLTVGGAGLTGVGSDDRRIPVSTAVMPWAALARLQVPGVSRCTAFLVDFQTAVTAAHCLYSRRLGGFVPAGSVHVLVGYDKGAFTKHAVAASFVVAQGYDPGAGPRAGAEDLAVVRFTQPVTDAARILPLSDRELPVGTPVMLAGYGQDRAEALLADTACTVQGHAGAGGTAVLVHDCEGTRGTSGAPLLVRVGATEWRVVGVQVTGRADGAGGTAVPAAAVRTLMER